MTTIAVRHSSLDDNGQSKYDEEINAEQERKPRDTPKVTTNANEDTVLLMMPGKGSTVVNENPRVEVVQLRPAARAQSAPDPH
jgi:hypothetical protein